LGRVRARAVGDRFRNAEGSTLLLVIFAVLLALAVLLGTVSASSLYLERKRLFLLADSAALAASQNFALESVAVDVAQRRLTFRLTPTDVVQASRAYLAAAGARGVRLVSASTPDGVTAEVRVASTWHPPVIGLFMPRGVPLEALGRARGTFF
jgi:uncharacterized membrane protein